MIIAVSASGNTLDAPVDPRFGRCSYFIIADSDTMNYEAVPNMAAGAMGGAGIQAAQKIASKNVKALITGNVGPNAFQTLSAAGIEIAVGASGTVREAIEKYRKGQLNKTGSATVQGHYGMGRGMGAGRGQRRRQQ
jgi:predicted Fe-Mo cluster-binding NifX family protein